MKKGKLIILEGTDSSGKTTQAGLLVERLGYKELRLPEYSLETGKLIKQFNDSGKKDIEESAYQSLMMANYLELLFKVILPELNKGQDIVMTRFTPSAIVYGNEFAKSDLEINYINDLTHSIEKLYHKLTYYQILFLDITAEEAEKRIEWRDKNTDQKREPVFENSDMIRKITSGYNKYITTYKIFDAEKEDFTVNGMQGREQVYLDIVNRIQ